MTFRKEIESLINRHSMENGSDTPDFILADYLVACLTAFDAAVKRREELRASKDPDVGRARVEEGSAVPFPVWPHHRPWQRDE